MEPQLPRTLNDLEEDLNRLTQKKEDRTKASSAASVEALQSSIDELLLMFKRANEELTLEQREEQIIHTQLDPVLKKLQDLSEQQETIANAIVTVSDAIDSLTSSVNEIKSRMGALELTSTVPKVNLPPSSGPSPFAPRPSYQRFEFNTGAMRSDTNQLPPPPPNQSIPSLSPNELAEKNGRF